MPKPATLRVVEPEALVTPQQQWLAMSAEIAAVEARAKRLRATRAMLKVGIMSELGTWGLSDDQVTAALRGRNA